MPAAKGRLALEGGAAPMAAAEVCATSEAEVGARCERRTGAASSETDNRSGVVRGVEVGAAARTRTTRREAGEAPMARRGCTAVPRSIALCALGAREAATDCITRVRRCVPPDRAFGGDVEDGPDPLGEPRRARAWGERGQLGSVDRKLRSVEPRIRGRKTDHDRSKAGSRPIKSSHYIATFVGKNTFPRGWLVPVLAPLVARTRT